MYFTIADRTFWDDYAALSDSLLEELRFWRYNLSAFHGYSIRTKLSFDYVIFTDASNHAYGGFISNSNTTVAYGIWSEQEQGQSSTFRELKAIQNVIESYAPLLAHSKVKLFSDSQGACSIVDKGSPKPILHQLAIDIFVLALHNDITLCPHWIPRSENERADIISKFLDKDDWKINPMIFDQLNRLWVLILSTGFPRITITKFGDLIRDSLHQDVKPWMHLLRIGQLKTPVSMIIPIIRHFMKCKAKGTLIIPEWRSAHFWPVIIQQPNKFAAFVTDF